MNEILECARKIKKYCEKRPDCDDCVFYSENLGDCALDYTNICTPDKWEIEEQ